MKKIYYSLLFCIAFVIKLQAQPLPCVEDPPSMTSFCMDACIICDIDGFEGRHDSEVPGEAPDDFCTFIVHNAQWIAFIAGSEDLSIELSVSNCDVGNGLEIAIYESFDCENFRIVSNCRGGMNPVSNNTSAVFSNTEPLVIGQYYFLVMDGNLADNCDWSFEVLEGSTQVDPLEASGLIEGPIESCPELTSIYTASGVPGATIYDWELNGNPIGSGEEIEVDWSNEGVFQLCLTASNACDEAPPSCRTIVVSSVPNTILEETICEGDSFMLNDSISLSDAGTYQFDFLDENSCDSIVLVELEVVTASFTDLAFDICDGDTISIGGTPYSTMGMHQEILENYLGCDSIVSLDLGIIICEIQGESDEIPVVCNGESSGAINFYIEDGTPPFSFNWMRLGGPEMGSGTINALDENISIQNLPAGTYIIEVQDDFDNDLVIIQEVTEPDVLTASLVASDYNGAEISCNGLNDGSLMANPLGGLEPYTYNWTNGGMSMQIDSLTAGNYAVQITDAGGCAISLEFELNQPSPVILDGLFSNPTCEGLETGFIQVNNVAGGVGDYMFSIGGSFDSNSTFSDLPEGTYTLAVQDANGCETEVTQTLVAPIIPVIDAGNPITIDLGEMTELRVFGNIPLSNVVWEEDEGLSCYDCPNPEVFAFNSTTYTVAVTSEDGCTTLDSVLVNVQKVRDVYIPNAFSPNDDGINDDFYIFGGPEVAQINQFMIFSRWGELVFEQKGIAVNDSKLGWDGTFLGKPMPTGIYTYYAQIDFIDGISFEYEGDILIVR